MEMGVGVVKSFNLFPPVFPFISLSNGLLCLYWLFLVMEKCDMEVNSTILPRSVWASGKKAQRKLPESGHKTALQRYKRACM